MADEEIKKTTPKKRTTTSKPKVEEPKPTSIEEQMAQMMAMMMAQQQQLMELMKNQKQEKEVEDVEEEYDAPKKPKRTRETNKMTKQQLRRKYKDTDIYLTNVSQGLVAYNGRNMTYEWRHPGDIEVVSIEDIVNMPKIYLKTPWLCLDGYENEEEVINDIIETLDLRLIYQYIYALQDMEENINKTTVQDVKEIIELSRRNGYDISMDLVILIERKIRSGELTNYVLIGQLSELLGRKFL